MDRLPAFIRLTGKPCLVVGGGVVAERKVRLLLRAGAAITVVAPALTPELQRLAKRAEIVHREAQYDSSRVAGQWLVVAATDDTQLNHGVAEAAEAAGILCNVVDDNDASSFILPAIVDRSPVIVAIGTEGTAPVLAQQLKRKIEAWLPPAIGELALQAGRWRQLVKRRFASMRERRRFWQEFFDGPIAEHLLAGRKRKAENAMRKKLLGSIENDTKSRGEGWIVGAGPGDPGLVTLRGQQLISRADVILYDRLVSKPVLDFARKEADFIAVGKSAGRRTMSQNQINELLVDLVSQGKRVCRLKGGDPFVFGRGGEEALALADAGLPFQVVPGISAALGCAAYSGIPLTLRGVSGSVTLATARLDNDLSPDWPELLNKGHTLALYMGVGALEAISEQLTGHGVSSTLPVAIVENGTTNKQRVILSTAADMVQDAQRAAVVSPSMLFLGEAVAQAERLQWFEGGTAALDFPISVDEPLTPLAATS